MNISKLRTVKKSKLVIAVMFVLAAVVIYLGLFAALRFVLEFFRGDDRSFVLYGLLSEPQMIALLTLIGSAAVYSLLRYRPMEKHKK